MATDRGEEACDITACGLKPAKEMSRQSCEATYRNVIEAQRDPEVSCPKTTKPFPTDSRVDGELVQRKFTFLSGEICNAYP